MQPTALKGGPWDQDSQPMKPSPVTTCSGPLRLPLAPTVPSALGPSLPGIPHPRRLDSCYASIWISSPAPELGTAVLSVPSLSSVSGIQQLNLEAGSDLGSMPLAPLEGGADFLHQTSQDWLPLFPLGELIRCAPPGFAGSSGACAMGAA